MDLRRVWEQDYVGICKLLEGMIGLEQGLREITEEINIVPGHGWLERNTSQADEMTFLACSR